MSQSVTNLSVEMTNCARFLKWRMCEQSYMCLCMYTCAWSHMANSEMKENYRGVKMFLRKNLFSCKSAVAEKRERKTKTESEQKIKSEDSKQYCPTILTGKHLLSNWSSCYL